MLVVTTTHLKESYIRPNGSMFSDRAKMTEYLVLNDNTMKMELEAGSQTRLFRFRGTPAVPEPSWQGHSVAEWQYTRVAPKTGELKVVTSRLRPGYLRKNGVPYSANATMTEYYHRMPAPNGDVWLTVISEVKDPENLREPYVQSSHFKKLAEGAAFKPEPCSAR